MPALWAVISFSIFIASMMQMSAPSSIVGALLDQHLEDVALQGGDERVAARAASAGRPALAPRRGSRAAGAAPLGDAASPRTLTSKRLPETSTR